MIVIALRFRLRPKISSYFDGGQPRSGISPTFWIGTAGGCVFFYALSVPDYNHREESKVAPISAKEFRVYAHGLNDNMVLYHNLWCQRLDLYYNLLYNFSFDILTVLRRKYFAILYVKSGQS